jgi:aminopeptidase-like protein
VSAVAAGDGERMYDLVGELYPLCRSITGEGLRSTLEVLRREIGVELHQIASGTQVLDWTVPREWSIRDAWVEDPAGRRVIDFRASNLHVVSYSTPVDHTMPLAELKEHLHTLPEQPDWVPYRTSYYSESWGFCASQRLVDSLPEGDYRVRIDSTLADGRLDWGELLIPGGSRDEVLLSCHVCHPSLANDNLSGIAVATWLAKRLQRAGGLRYSYRLLFVPGTIGSISWLATHREQLDRVRHGLVLACVGDPGPLTYKRSRRGDAPVDRAMAHVLERGGRPYRVVDFSPYGYDERQYCSPGFDLPVGSLSRTPYGQYPEYHTSADDLSLVRPACLEESLETCWRLLRVLEGDRRYLNLSPYGEPQLGRRGLYGSTGGQSHTQESQMAMLWVLNLADGRHSLLDVAERAGLEFELVEAAAARLRDGGLLAEAD